MGNCFRRCGEGENYTTMSIASENITADHSIGGIVEEEVVIQHQVYGTQNAHFLHDDEDGEEEVAEIEESMDYISHPFICNDALVNLLQTMKVMFVMRGVPGSGKTVLSSVIQRRYPAAVVCSADHFWMTPEGEYQFDASRLKEAHNDCQNRAYRACQSGDPQVIIDNTNVRRWEFKYYTDLAGRFGYFVIIVEPETPWRFDAELLASKGRHSVPLNIIEAKIKAFEAVPVPVYFGWFLTAPSSKELQSRANAALSALQSVPSALARCELSANFNLSELFNWSDRQLHITSKFCDRGRLPEGIPYSTEARRQLYRVFHLPVYALIITCRVIGAAIGPLDQEALALWANGDEENLPPGAKAHVTLATAPQVRPLQTGIDLVTLLQRLEDGQLERVDDWSTGELWCSQTSGEGCLLQLKQPIWLDTVFGQFL